jgi:hypothetical protein
MRRRRQISDLRALRRVRIAQRQVIDRYIAQVRVCLNRGIQRLLILCGIRQAGSAIVTDVPDIDLVWTFDRRDDAGVSAHEVIDLGNESRHLL